MRALVLILLGLAVVAVLHNGAKRWSTHMGGAPTDESIAFNEAMNQRLEEQSAELKQRGAEQAKEAAERVVREMRREQEELALRQQYRAERAKTEALAH